MTSKHLSQEEIDALLNNKVPESPQSEETIDTYLDEHVTGDLAAGPTTDQDVPVSATSEPVVEQELLTDEEKDALGEVGNICMGSSSTALSQLLKQPVSITSPRVEITTLEEFFKSFTIPHISIRVNFIEGLTGYNYLIMKLKDTAVLADLMMGGDGANISGEITEITISAASEAMNQMIGVASTAMATIFSRTVNISPPETKIYRHPDEIELPEPGHVVVIWFKMTVGSILDTEIMQVMDMTSAQEQAGLILGQLEMDDEDEGQLPTQEETREETLDYSIVSVEDAHTEPYPGAGKTTGPVVSPLSGVDTQHLGLIMDVPLKVTVLLGRTKWSIKDILELTPGSVVELQSLVDEPVEVLVNGTLVAMGEIVVVNENFGVQLTQIIKPEERMQNIRK
ncbi:MAG: flagellar motor switch phosphatase FliY [Peptococcaceae bacterium]|nr:flagellar motor switch phosphatase FliY [Peptococcaceae bacterium]